MQPQIILEKANMDALIVKGGLEHFDIVALNFWGS
jgi:hypothetical protein